MSDRRERVATPEAHVALAKSKNGRKFPRVAVDSVMYLVHSGTTITMDMSPSTAYKCVRRRYLRAPGGMSDSKEMTCATSRVAPNAGNTAANTIMISVRIQLKRQ